MSLHDLKPRHRAALEAVAEHAVAQCVHDGIGEMWGDLYPEIGEYDWERIVSIAAKWHPFNDVDDALTYLARRLAESGDAS